MKKELLATISLTAASLGVAGVGTTHQRDCFNGVANDYGVESVRDLPERVIDDSGCVSWANTLGSLGVVGGLGLTGVVVWRGRRQDSAEASPGEQIK